MTADWDMNMSPSTARSDTELWCAGLPLGGRRELTPIERSDIRTMRRLRLRSAAALALGALVFFAGVAAAVAQLPHRMPISDISELVITLGAVGMVGAVAWATLRIVRTLHTLRPEVTVFRYEGRIEEALRDRTQVALMDAGWLEVDAAPVQTVETLGRDGIVWTANGTRIPRWLPGRAVEIAATPAMAAIGAEWVQPMANAPADAPHVNRRQLSRAECAELARFRRRLVLRAAPVALVINAWTWSVAAACLLSGRIPAGREAVTFALLLLSTVSTDFQLARYLRLSRRFGGDIHNGDVLIVRMVQKDDPEPNESERTTDAATAVGSASPNLGPAVETLPISHALWTIGGRPAPWRITVRR